MLGAGSYAVGRMTGLQPVLELRGGKLRVLARRRGFGSAAAAALDMAREAMRRGPGAAVVTLSFGGDPRIVRNMPSYQDLEAQAASHRAELHLAVMSPVLGSRLGPGALSLAWVEGEG